MSDQPGSAMIAARLRIGAARRKWDRESGQREAQRLIFELEQRGAGRFTEIPSDEVQLEYYIKGLKRELARHTRSAR